MYLTIWFNLIKNQNMNLTKEKKKNKWTWTNLLNMG